MERASRFQTKLFELLRRGAELAELVNGRACGEESERLKGFGEKLIEVKVRGAKPRRHSRSDRAVGKRLTLNGRLEKRTSLKKMQCAEVG